MNISTLINSMRDAVSGNAALSAWCTTNYSQTHKVYIGVDTRKPPASSDYPVVHIFPLGKSMGYELEAENHVIGVNVGVYDDDSTTTGNVIEMEGVANLEAFRKLVETAFIGAVTSPQRIERIEAEYESLEFFPFFLCGMEVHVSDEYFGGNDAFK